MKRFGKKILLAIMLAVCALCLAFAACGSNDEVEIKFETNGGDPIEAALVEKGTTYTLPTPTRGETFSFEGWYAAADFSGEPVTETVADSDVTYYAKWEQLYELRLGLNGGTLSVTHLYLKEGASIYDAVKDLLPVKDGWQFGTWSLNGADLTRNAQMQTEAVDLSARYKVGYTVEVFEQDLDQEGYTRADNYVGYEYVTGSDFTPAVPKTGFVMSATVHSDEQRTKPLTETPSQNVYRIYYDRAQMSVMIYSNYPDSREQEHPVILSETVLYGSTLVLTGNEIEQNGISPDGYILSGWTVYDSKNSDSTLRSHYIDHLAVNGNGNAPEDAITVTDTLMVTAQWSRAYSDIMNGADLIYHFGSEEIVYLDREGVFFSGEYDPASSSFTFLDEETGDIRMQGKLRDNNQFIYGMESRLGVSANYYSIEEGIDNNISITLDEYDGLTYKQGKTTSEGTYTIDGDGNYHVTFHEGTLNGQTQIMRFIRLSVNGSVQTVFQVRNEAENGLKLYFASVVMGASASAEASLGETGTSVVLDGYGTATMTSGSSSTSYYYSYSDDNPGDAAGDTLTLLNSTGTPYGIFRIVRISGILCYISYTAERNALFRAANGATLRLDGVSQATYTPVGSTAITGYYMSGSSAFGGAIVRFRTRGVTYVFHIKSETNEGDGTTVNTFEVKPEGYAEYYYTNGSARMQAPFIVFNRDAGDEDKAYIYGATAQNELKPVAEGTYTYNSENMAYTLQIDSTAEIPYPEDILTDPVDLRALKVVVFGVGSVNTNSGSYPIAYWHTAKKADESVIIDNTTVYTGTYNGQQAELTLVCGFAVLKLGDGAAADDWHVGTYIAHDTYTTVNMTIGESTFFYVKLAEDAGGNTFLHLTELLGSALERNADGTANTNVTFEFDGMGGATLIIAQEEGEPTDVKGTIVRVEDLPNVEGLVYEFTPEGGAGGFRFIMLRDGNGNAYFTRETAGYSGEYAETNEGGGTLTLDGFGFRAVYVPAEGEEISGVYSIITSIVESEGSRQFIRVISDGSEVYYFDIEAGNAFTVRGSEYGRYRFISNASYDGYTLTLDGHGNAILEKTGSPVTLAARGTYTVNADFSIQLNLTLETGITNIPVQVTGILSAVRLSSSASGQAEPAFFVEEATASEVYIDRENWVVLVIDEVGGATRYGEYGVAERGQCIFITDDLLYYVNTEGSDACTYRYNTETKEIVRKEFSQQGYYTAELDALLFTQYGYMTYNGSTLYYYDIDEHSSVTIYRRAFGEEGEVNDFGFRTFQIGVLSDEMTFTTVGGAFGTEVYYKANGYAITFTRSEADKRAGAEEGAPDRYKFPLALSAGDQTRYSLENLTFAPTGSSSSFRSTATVNINGNKSGVVYRTTTGEGDERKVETYLVYNGYRFDLKLTYNGVKNASYQITQMRKIGTYQSNSFLTAYMYILVMAGIPLSDTAGTITIVAEYGEDGAVTENYIDLDLGVSSVLGTYQHERIAYTVSGTGSAAIYALTVPKHTDETADAAEDPYDYRLYFRLIPNGLYSLFGYNITGYTIVAYTRVETPATGNDSYTVTTERVLASDGAYDVGDYFSIKLEAGTDPKQEVKADHIYQFSNGVFYYISYTRDEGTSVTDAAYYKLIFTEKNSGDLDEDAVKVLESVAVTGVETTLYHTEEGSYAEVLKGEGPEGTDLIVHFYYGGDRVVRACTYDADTKTYTVTTNDDKTYCITVTDEVNKKVTISEVTETRA